MSCTNKNLSRKKSQDIYTKAEDVKYIFSILEKEYPNIKKRINILCPFDCFDSEFTKYLCENEYRNVFSIGNNKDGKAEYLKINGSNYLKQTKEERYDYNLDFVDGGYLKHISPTTIVVTNPPYNMAQYLIHDYVTNGINFILFTSNLINSRKLTRDYFINDEVVVIGQVQEFKDEKKVPSYIVTNIKRLKKYRQKKQFYNKKQQVIDGLEEGDEPIYNVDKVDDFRLYKKGDKVFIPITYIAFDYSEYFKPIRLENKVKVNGQTKFLRVLVEIL